MSTCQTHTTRVEWLGVNQSRQLRVALGLRRWARYAMARSFMGTGTHLTFERLNRAADRAYEALEPDDRTIYQLNAVDERRKRTNV